MQRYVAGTGRGHLGGSWKMVWIFHRGFAPVSVYLRLSCYKSWEVVVVLSDSSGLIPSFSHWIAARQGGKLILTQSDWTVVEHIPFATYDSDSQPAWHSIKCLLETFGKTCPCFYKRGSFPGWEQGNMWLWLLLTTFLWLWGDSSLSKWSVENRLQ